MKIDVLSLKNFRCFEEIEIPLHENLTVIVAQMVSVKQRFLML